MQCRATIPEPPYKPLPEREVINPKLLPIIIGKIQLLLAAVLLNIIGEQMQATFTLLPVVYQPKGLLKKTDFFILLISSSKKNKYPSGNPLQKIRVLVILKHGYRLLEINLYLLMVTTPVIFGRRRKYYRQKKCYSE